MPPEGTRSYYLRRSVIRGNVGPLSRSLSPGTRDPPDPHDPTRLERDDRGRGPRRAEIPRRTTGTLVHDLMFGGPLSPLTLGTVPSVFKL